jgi:hypothetical protein
MNGNQFIYCSFCRLDRGSQRCLWLGMKTAALTLDETLRLMGPGSNSLGCKVINDPSAKARKHVWHVVLSFIFENFCGVLELAESKYLLLPWKRCSTSRTVEACAVTNSHARLIHHPSANRSHTASRICETNISTTLREDFRCTVSRPGRLGWDKVCRYLGNPESGF